MVLYFFTVYCLHSIFFNCAPSLEDAFKKRGGGDLTRSSIDNKRTRCGTGETAKSLIPGLPVILFFCILVYLYLSAPSYDVPYLFTYGLDGGSDQVVLGDLGEELALKLSKSVVSLALSVGHFACSGIAIECKGSVTRFLTTGSLARALYNEGKYHYDVKIEVRHEGNVVTGFLEEHDLDHEYSIVKITSSLDVRAVFFNHALQFMPYCKVVSLGRDISGKLMAASGKLSSESSDNSEYLMFSSCKLSEVWEGGPLFDFAGNIAGMNVVPSMERSFFVPKSLIIEQLQHFWTSQERVVFLQRVKMLKMIREGQTDSHPEVHGDAPHKDLHGGLEALAKRFAINWDDECECNDHQTILTSACLVRTPKYPFDDGNKIADGLRIEVVLPNKQRKEGTLMHYNLLNNVVLVSVRKSCSVSPVILKHEKVDQSSKLVAVGRCFKSGDLVASSGKLVFWSTHMITNSIHMEPHVESLRLGLEGLLLMSMGIILA